MTFATSACAETSDASGEAYSRGCGADGSGASVGGRSRRARCCPGSARSAVAAFSYPLVGFYLGALFGYSWGSGDVSPGPNVDVSGIDGGVYAGAGYQFDRLVVGGEADVLGSSIDGKAAGLSLDQGINGSLRGRAGIALDQFLLYGTAGLAATKLEASKAGGSDDKGLLGWTAGVGGEAMLTKNVTARVEYRYTDYEDKTFTVGGGPVSTDLKTQGIRAGLGVKF